MGTATARQWRCSVVPAALFAATTIVVGAKHLETFVNTFVLIFDVALAFHIGLTEAQINVKVRIRLRANSHKRPQQQR